MKRLRMKTMTTKNPAAVELGRKGGSVKSEAKRLAALKREELKRLRKQHEQTKNSEMG